MATASTGTWFPTLLTGYYSLIWSISPFSTPTPKRHFSGSYIDCRIMSKLISTKRRVSNKLIASSVAASSQWSFNAKTNSSSATSETTRQPSTKNSIIPTSRKKSLSNSLQSTVRLTQLKNSAFLLQEEKFEKMPKWTKIFMYEVDSTLSSMSLGPSEILLHMW